MTRIVIHERWKCIGCGACAAVAPEHWEMSEDGYADLKGCTKEKKPEGTLEKKEIDEKDLPDNQNAADSCPVNCIHIKNPLIKPQNMTK